MSIAIEANGVAVGASKENLDLLDGVADVAGEVAESPPEIAFDAQADAAETLPDSPQEARGETGEARGETGEAQPSAEPAAKPDADRFELLEREILQLRGQLDAFRQQDDEIAGFRDSLQDTNDKLTKARSQYTKAKSRVKELEEERAELSRDLMNALSDLRSGQMRLAFTEPAGPPASPAPAAITPETQPGTAEQTESAPASLPAITQPDPNSGKVWGIGVLGQKEILKLVGDDEVAACKSREEPIGLTEKQLDTLEAQGWTTIASLEKAMRENAWWHKDAGLGEKGTARVTETLRVWRLHHPQGVQD